MKSKSIDVLMVVAGISPCKVSIRGTYNSLKNFVNPSLSLMAEIGVIMLEKDVALIYNSKGALSGLKGNRKVGESIIAGTFFVVGVKNGTIASLAKEKQEKYCKRFEKIEIYSDKEVSACYWDSWLDKTDEIFE